jgi:hypothetical protein
MSCRSLLERWVGQLAVLGALASIAPAVAGAPAVLAFGPNTWHELTHSKQRPLVVVFSTTDCVHCPKAIDELATALRLSNSRVRLAVVVMDGSGQERDLVKDRHYRKAHSLYAFDGDAQALRYTVNPDWRGLTPYVALIAVGGAASFHAGAPTAGVLREFLRP